MDDLHAEPSDTTGDRAPLNRDEVHQLTTSPIWPLTQNNNQCYLRKKNKFCNFLNIIMNKGVCRQCCSTEKTTDGTCDWCGDGPYCDDCAKPAALYMIPFILKNRQN